MGATIQGETGVGLGTGHGGSGTMIVMSGVPSTNPPETCWTSCCDIFLTVVSLSVNLKE